MKRLTQVTILLAGIFFLSVGSAFAQFDHDIQQLRPYTKEGINEFEGFNINNNIPFDGPSLKIGANFAQQWQSLIQSTDGMNPSTGSAYALNDLGPGFNLATANLNLDAQLADGMRVHLTSYLSSRHHSETWVKSGYLQVDKLPMLNSEPVSMLMHFLTLRVGHFEVNYGDGHYRRTDNANAMYNPFVGNYLMDAFTTEVGAEAYIHNFHDFMAMVGMTGGKLHPDVTKTGQTPSVYGKVGYDNYADDGVRFRLTGSVYHNNNRTNLYGGDRAGSRYYGIMQPGNDFSGRVSPAFSNGFTSFMVNPFVEYKGLELHGLYENTNEKSTDEDVNQISGDLVYRFGNADQIYIGGRYTSVNGHLVAGMGEDVTVNRLQLGAGWFLTENILMKAEYVNQEYKDYPTNNFFHEAEFHGVMVEAAVGF